MNSPFSVSSKSSGSNPLNSRSAWLPKKATNTNPVEMCVDPNEVIPLGGDQRGTRIRVISGEIWLTQKFDPEDYLLATGDEFEVRNPGRVVVQGLEESLIQVTPGN